LLIIISITTILGLLIGLFTVGSLDFIHEGWFYQNSLILNNSGLPIWVVSILAFILVGIPFFFLFSLGLRILSNNSKTVGKVANLSLLGIWLVALLITIFFGTKQYMNTAYDGTVINSQEVNLTTNDTLNIKFSKSSVSNKVTLRKEWGYEVVFDENNEERIYSDNIRLNIHPSDNDRIFVKTRKRSSGKSKEDARDNAREIDHDFYINDKDLELNGYFLTDVINKFREQKIYIDLFIPTGQTIFLDKTTKSYLYDIDNIQDVYDRDMIKHYYKMTDEGLDCLDCNSEDDNEIKVSGDNEINLTGDNESFNMKIDKKGVHIEIKDENNERAEVRIDEKGILIEKTKDTI